MIPKPSRKPNKVRICTEACQICEIIAVQMACVMCFLERHMMPMLVVNAPQAAVQEQRGFFRWIGIKSYGRKTLRKRLLIAQISKP